VGGFFTGRKGRGWLEFLIYGLIAFVVYKMVRGVFQFPLLVLGVVVIWYLMSR